MTCQTRWEDINNPQWLFKTQNSTWGSNSLNHISQMLWLEFTSVCDKTTTGYQVSSIISGCECHISCHSLLKLKTRQSFLQLKKVAISTDEQHARQYQLITLTEYLFPCQNTVKVNQDTDCCHLRQASPGTELDLPHYKLYFDTLTFPLLLMELLCS